MADPRVLPAHMLAGYVWELWKANQSGVDVITAANGKKLARIAPISDEPDLRSADVTYILYGFAESETGPLNVHHTGQFSMRIIAKNFSEMTTLIRILQSAFELEDEAAQNINWWSTTRPGYDGMMFTSVCVSFIEAADAETTEGGRLEGVVSLRYRYLMETPVKVFSKNELGETVWV